MSRNKKKNSKTPKSETKATKTMSAYQAEKNVKSDSPEPVIVKRKIK